MCLAEYMREFGLRMVYVTLSMYASEIEMSSCGNIRSEQISVAVLYQSMNISILQNYYEHNGNKGIFHALL